ncbi:MAG TPA: HAMP domain-containing sensor histidine kinase [Dehalococcoidia bacterium]|nr:HAMP domain-containing sensor histidine kinase [Dehalococcoidia bacterium]
MKAAPKQILFVALKAREAGPVMTPLRTAGHLVSLIEEIESAGPFLASHAFDQAVVPAHVLESLLRQRALWEASDGEAWSSSTAGLAHDLRFLLNALRQGIAELDEECQPRPAAGERLNEVCGRISTLSGFLSELILELDRDADEELHTTIVDLEEVIEAASVTVYSDASEKGQRLVVDVDEEVTHIRADRTKLKRVLANLLDYAVRQTPRLDTVTLRAMPVQDECVIAVLDGGGGITSSELQRLFSPPLGVAGAAGTGLPQVKRMVEQHGGRVWVESHKDSGTTVFVSFPRVPTARGGRPRVRP